MGTASTTKFIKNNAGTLQEEAALTTSAGVADAQKVVALNAAGILDPSILNATVASSPDKIVQLDNAGRIDLSVLPVGLGPDTAIIIASETLLAGDLINVWNNGGIANVRKADATTPGKEAQGYVLVGVAAAGSVLVYFEGPNTQCTGLTPGKLFLSNVTPGRTMATAPTTTGHVIQIVGFAVSATTLNFQSGTPITLA